MLAPGSIVIVMLVVPSGSTVSVTSTVVPGGALSVIEMPPADRPPERRLNMMPLACAMADDLRAVEGDRVAVAEAEAHPAGAVADDLAEEADGPAPPSTRTFSIVPLETLKLIRWPPAAARRIDE